MLKAIGRENLSATTITSQPCLRTLFSGGGLRQVGRGEKPSFFPATWRRLGDPRTTNFDPPFYSPFPGTWLDSVIKGLHLAKESRVLFCFPHLPTTVLLFDPSFNLLPDNKLYFCAYCVICDQLSASHKYTLRNQTNKQTHDHDPYRFDNPRQSTAKVLCYTPK